MENIPSFIDCKHGRTVVRYEHPALEPILRRTYGVFAYQEQVMEAARQLAGFTLAQADELRRAMGKKLASEMEAKRKSFLEGCAKNKIPANKAEKIFQTMEKFAGYGFNASHSAAYALIAYQCAWLKAHHPAEFMAATLTSEMSDSARIVTLIEETKRLGIAIQPPDVNCSAWKFTLEEGAVRFGLGAVRNVGQAVVDALVAAREEGAYRDLYDLAHRLENRVMNRRVLESLIASGACDALGPDRATLFAGAGRVLDLAASAHRDRASGQSSLFGGGDDSAVAVASPPLIPADPWTSRERSTREKEVLGFYFSEHPLEPLREQLERIRTHSIVDALTQEDGTEARLAGLLGESKALTTKSGRRMAIVTLEDQSGRIECTVFPDTYDQNRALLEPETIVVVTGRIEVREERGAKLLVAEVRKLEEAQQAYRQSLHLEVRAEELTEPWLREVDEVLSRFPGESEVYLHIVRPDRSRVAMRSKRFRVVDDDDVVLALRHRFPAVRARWGKAAT
jgi:DNA polymerase-3 subunit alpha